MEKNNLPLSSDEPAEILLKRMHKDSKKELVFEKDDLPKGWSEIIFKKIVKKLSLNGKKLKQKEYEEKGKLPVIDQGQDLIGGFTNKIELKIDCNLPVIVFGDHTKAVKFIEQNFVAGADGVQVLEPKSPLIPKLIYYFIQAIPLPNKGYARHYQYLEKTLIKIPPLNEQKRIVEKIESIFSQIDEKKKQILALIENNRERIDFFEKNLFSYVIDREIEHHPERKNWEISTLGEILEPSKQKFDPQKEKSRPFVGLEHIEKNSRKIISTGNSTNTKSLKNVFQKGDILYGRLRPYLNKVAVPDFDGVCSTDILVFSKSKNLNSDYVSLFLSSNTFVKFASNNMTGTQHPRIKLDAFSEFNIPLPPLNEQKRIASILSNIDAQIQSQKQKFENIKNSYESTIKYIKHMQSSILDVAFSGKLVPQDPGDEPAEILLEKIKKKK